MCFAQLNIKHTLKINRLQYVFVILDVHKAVMHMALHKIDIALGPEATLNALSEKYPERGFLKYRSADDHRKFMLLDVSDEKTVFQSGLNYKVMQSIIDSWDDRNKRPLGLKSYVETRWLSSVMPATSPLLSTSTSA